MTSFVKKDFRIDLSTARKGQGELISVLGRGVQVVDASDPNAIVNMAVLGDFTADPLEMILQAKIYVGKGFEGFYLTNDAQPGAWILLSVTDGDNDFLYDRPISNAISSIAAPVKVASVVAPVMETGGQNASYGDLWMVNANTAYQAFAANANGTGWVIHNNGTVSVYLGSDNTVTTGTGMPLAPGEKFGWDNRTDVWVVSASAGQHIRWWAQAV